MELKLAEYRDGKFEGFIEMANGEIFCYPETGMFLSDQGFLLGNECIHIGRDLDYYELDEKDPLNRFDGLFDGRTYGDGRFVLIINNQDRIVHDHYETPNYYLTNWKREAGREGYSYFSSRLSSDLILSGNLHENPELWEKVK